MSRTFRRQQQAYCYDWELREYSWSNGYLQHYTLDPKSLEGKKRLARFHGDAGFGSINKKSAPRWYRRRCNKRYSSIEKKQLIRYLKGVEPDAVLINRKRNASWYW